MIDFNNLIDNHFYREPKQKPVGKYYPSEVGGCLRKTWFSYKYPKELPLETMKIFGIGDLYHNLVTNVLKSEKNKDIELLETELPFKLKQRDFEISGRIDNIVLAKIENQKTIIEVKSTKRLPFKPNQSHIMQIQLYMNSTEIHNGIILYVQKDNLQTRTFDIAYDREKVHKVVRRFHILHECIQENKLPKAEAKLIKEDNWMCNYCNYKENCDIYTNEEQKVNLEIKNKID